MLLIRNLTRHKIPKGFLASVKKLFLLLKIPKNVEVSLVLAPPALMQKLNRRYRRKNKPANVLSFGVDRKERNRVLQTGRGMLGEVFICPYAAKQEARIFGITLQEQLTTLLVHAILHIKGYSHARVREGRIMERKERAIIKRLLKQNKGVSCAQTLNPNF